MYFYMLYIQFVIKKKKKPFILEDPKLGLLQYSPLSSYKEAAIPTVHRSREG